MQRCELLRKALVLTGLALLFYSSVSLAQTCNESILFTKPTSDFEEYSLNNGLAFDEIKDIKTNLIWKRCAEGQEWDGVSCLFSATTHSWRGALSLAEGDWRLPNIKELVSIVEMACTNPAINTSVFPNTATSFRYWSSTNLSFKFDGEYSGWSFMLGFDTGKEGQEWRLLDGYVRLVRDGE